jgi:DNA gyrase/topoisomerase IV subunit A
VSPYKTGTTRFNLGGRTHTETLTQGKQRAIITELK